MESGIPYDCAFSWIISFYETYYLFSASMVRYELRYSESVLFLPGILKGITLNAPVLIASAVFLNKVSWAAMILASGGLAYVKFSCFEMTLLTSNIGIQLDYVVRYVKKKKFPLELSTLFSLDTIYACQDKKDDANAGVKSITLVLQNNVKIALGFFAAVLVSSWLICGVLTGCGMAYFLITVVGGGFVLAYDLFNIDLDDPKSCLHAVRLTPSTTVLMLIFLDSSNTMAS